jgi:hypothetical protein
MPLGCAMVQHPELVSGTLITNNAIVTAIWSYIATIFIVFYSRRTAPSPSL